MTACIGLGSNLGDSLSILWQAWQALGDHPAIGLAALSPPFQSAPLDMVSKYLFINAAGLLITSLPPGQLLEVLLATEVAFGRQRAAGSTGYQDRSLDLDLLFFDDHVFSDPGLILPHPAMHRRLFVLEPLFLIAPEYQHPLLGETVETLRTRLVDQGVQERPLQLSWPEQGNRRQPT